MIRIARITGEAIDADYVDIPTEHEDPAYPYCEFCEAESDNAEGFCSSCGEYAADTAAHMKAVAERWKPLSELKRTGTGGWL